MQMKTVTEACCVVLGLVLSASAGLLDQIAVRDQVVAWLGSDRYQTKTTRVVIPAKADSPYGSVTIDKVREKNKLRVHVTVTPPANTNLYFCGQRFEFDCGWGGAFKHFLGLTLDTEDVKGVKRANKIQLFDPKDLKAWNLNRMDYKTLAFIGESGVLRVTAGENCTLGVSHYGAGFSFDAWYAVPDPESKPAFDRPVSYEFTLEEL